MRNTCIAILSILTTGIIWAQPAGAESLNTQAGKTGMFLNVGYTLDNFAGPEYADYEPIRLSKRINISGGADYGFTENVCLGVKAELGSLATEVGPYLKVGAPLGERVRLGGMLEANYLRMGSGYRPMGENFDGSALGVAILGTWEYFATRGFLLGLDLGYHHEFVSGRDAWRDTPLEAPWDLNGLFVKFGLTFRFWV